MVSDFVEENAGLNEPAFPGPEGAVGFEPWLVRITRAAGHLAAQKYHRPYSSAWARADLARLHDPEYVELLSMVHMAQPDVSADEMVRRKLTAAQARLIDDPDYLSPGYKEPVIWYQKLSWLASRRSPHRVDYFFDHFRRLKTSVSGRGVAFKLAGLVLAHRFGPRPSIADLGCSDTSLARQLVHNATIPYVAPQAADWQKDGTKITNQEKTGLLKELIAEPFEPGPIVGADLEDPDEPSIKRYTRACRSPEEIQSGLWETVHTAVMHTPLPEGAFMFVRGNFAHRRIRTQIVRALGEQARIALCSFSWYEGGQKEQRAKANNAAAIVEPDGYVLYLEPARIHWRDRGRLEVLDEWSEIGLFLHEVATGALYHLARFDNGRLGKVEILSDFAHLAKGGPYEQEITTLAAR